MLMILTVVHHTINGVYVNVATTRTTHIPTFWGGIWDLLHFTCRCPSSRIEKGKRGRNGTEGGSAEYISPCLSLSLFLISEADKSGRSREVCSVGGGGGAQLLVEGRHSKTSACCCLGEKVNKREERGAEAEKERCKDVKGSSCTYIPSLLPCL